jgi:hypothetical protein
MALNISKRVKPMKTAWAEPWDHGEVVLHMDSILVACGINSPAARVKMTAHAIFASGWRQNCWNYNAWGVKVGSWEGAWFSKGTQEADDSGAYYSTTAAWRAFDGWRDAVRDYTKRIGPDSWSEKYRKAAGYLPVEGSEADRQFWASLGAGGYYTDKQFGPDDFASLCRRVRTELNSATEVEMERARDWAAKAVGNSPGKGVPLLGFPFPVVAAVAAVALVVAVLVLMLRLEK